MSTTTCITYREVLTSNRTYYVATTGSDSNNGLSSGTPFLTIQKAVDVVSEEIDLNKYNITISVADGTYSTTNTYQGITSIVNLKPYIGSGQVTLQGNTSTPANAILSATSANCISALDSSYYLVQGFKVITTTSGIGVSMTNSFIDLGDFEFGTCITYHFYAGRETLLRIVGDYDVTGNTSAHWYCEGGTLLIGAVNVTFIAAPNVGTTAMCFYNGVICTAGTFFSGSTTSLICEISTNGIVDSRIVGSGNIPGLGLGTIDYQGQFIT